MNRLIFATVFCFIAHNILYAQPFIGKIEGIVLDEFEHPVEGALIEITNYRNSLPQETTISGGQFTITVPENVKITDRAILYFKTSKDGYITSYDTSTVNSSGQIHKTNFKISKKIPLINGRIINSNGYPAINLYVDIPEFGNNVMGSNTDSLGDFVLDVSRVNYRKGMKVRLNVWENGANRRLLFEREVAANQYGNIYNIVRERESEVSYPDKDKDGIRDDADKCPCDWALTKRGCPKDPGKFLKIIPGLYDRKYLRTIGWGASIFLTTYSIIQINNLDDELPNATSQNQFNSIENEKKWWKAGAIAGAAGFVLTYILDNVNLKNSKNKKSCLEIDMNQNSIGIHFSLKF